MQRRSPPGFQRHHLVPQAVLRRPQVRQLMDNVASIAEDRRRFGHNCLWLPCDEQTALSTGRVLHRGPHPRYNDVVDARIDRILARGSGRADLSTWAAAAVSLARLQCILARILAGRGPRLIKLNRQDPMRAFADYSYLDDAISRMSFDMTSARASAAIGASQAGIGGPIFPFEPVNQFRDTVDSGDAADPLA